MTYNLGNLVADDNATTVRVVIATGAVTHVSTDQIIIIHKTVPAATTVNLMASPPTGQMVTIKDGAGNAGTDNITITPNAGNIDGAGTYVISANYGYVVLVFNGTIWNTI